MNDINADEVAYFEQLADTWWDENGPFWPLHKLNSLRIQWILSKLSLAYDCSQPLKGLNVLDIGCGGGLLSEALAQHGANVTAIDVVEKNIYVAKSHLNNALNIDYQHSSIEEICRQGLQFDIVFNMEVVEHVDDFQRFMHKNNSLVKDNGFVFLSSINRNLFSGLIAIFAAEYVLAWLPKGTHHYHKLRKPEEIIRLLNSDNIHVVDKTGVAVNPFNKQMRTVNHLWVNYMLFAQKNTQPI